ncbi:MULTISPECIES: ABC transporter substrate-binding protein [Desertihabitans]|uniref:ABC transporter substrate-binding protein n=1 Tax=Desertihabitans brevis TaxID=2268447 RepID=A0A367YU05_9ACTN|nr:MULTISPECIES: ABC transporter substrate-binding protein [Desertihabitans]RCK69375.1 ABC transporter substrate-binding protein [Desertihabitans brevis]
MRNWRTSRTLSVLAAGTALTLLAACGGGGGGPAGGGSTASGPVPEPAEPVTITFSSWVGEQDGMKRLYAKFREQHPNITVEFQNVPAEESEKKLTTQIAGGNPPDAAYVDAGTVANFASRGALVNLDNYISRSEVVSADDYVPAFRAFTEVEGGMHGLPFDGESTGLFYRTDLFEEAGISEPPATWEEFEEVSQKLTDPAAKRYAFPVFAPEAEYYFYPWLWQNGGTLLSEDEQTILFNAPEAKEAAEFYVGLTQYAPPDYLNSNSYDARLAFANGQVGMYMAGAWFAGVLDEEFPDLKDKWASAPLPEGKAGCATTIAGDALVMFAQGEEQDAAWKWLEFLSEPDNMAEWTFRSEGTLLPPRQSLLDSPELVETKPVLQTFADLMECGVNYNITDPAWPRISEELNTQLGSAMYGEQTASQALDNAAAEAEKLRS